MSTYAFDIEIYKNFLSVVFVNVENEFDQNTFVVFEDKDDRQKIKDFIVSPITLCGYNNIYFDNVLLNALSEGYNCEGLFSLSQQIIRGENQDTIFNLRRKKVPYKSIDFKELLGLDISLKQAIVVLEWPKIQDLPIPYDATIKPEDVSILVSYNENDVLPLVKLWDNLQPEIELRKRVNQLYKVDVTTESEGRIPNAIFEKLYSSAVGIPIKEIKLGRTIRDKVLLGDCVDKNISFSSSELSSFLSEIKSFDLTERIKENIYFGGLVFNFGVGGLHTQDKPAGFYSSDDEVIIDADVTSFYPNIVLRNKIKPQHLSEDFLTIFENMTRERIEAKVKKDKIKADILKISINAVFGKLGNPDYWFYDPQAFFSVTISGQLYLLSLVEFLILRGFEVISANTDGIITKVLREREEEYYQACKEWETLTGFELEFTHYEKYIRRDVNNYIAQGNNKVKRKGDFVCKEDNSLYKRLSQSYSPEIIPQALTNYFVNDIPVEDTLASSKNIFDFFMSQRVNKKFKTIFRNGNDIELQHTNRYYASLEGGIILKKDTYKEVDREISILAGTLVQIANDIDRNRPFEDYQVNLKYYKDEVMKIINVIEPSVEQLSLF